MRIRTLGGRPIAQFNSPNIGGAMTGHRGLVLHSAEGTYQGTIAWQLNPNQRYSDGTSVTTSSTFIVGRQDGEWAQMVDSDVIAWCQRAGSRDWMSIELAGFAPSQPSQWQIWACAQLLAWANHTYDVPMEVTANTASRGLGHHSMDNDTTVQWGHDACPGAGVVNSKAAIARMARAIGEDDDMTPEQDNRLKWIDARLEALCTGQSDILPDRPGAGQDMWPVRALEALRADLSALLKRPPATVDVAALAEALYAVMPHEGLTRAEIRSACEEAVRIVAADAGTP